MTRALRRILPQSPACALLAGLLLFQPLLLAADALEDEAPVRRIAPATPAPSAADQAELDKLKQALDALSAKQEEHHEAQSRGLSRSAQALAEDREMLQSLQSGQARSQTALDGAKQRLEDLGARLQSLEQLHAKEGESAAAREARLDEAIKAQAQLRLQAQEDRDSLKDAFKALKDTQAKLDERTLKLASLTDLLSVIKQDVDQDHEEVVELKQTIKALEPKASEQGGLAWWDQALRWPYLPAVAVGLSAVAVGLAAHR